MERGPYPFENLEVLWYPKLNLLSRISDGTEPLGGGERRFAKMLTSIIGLVLALRSPYR